MKYKLTIKNAIESPLKVFVPPQLKSLFELFTFVSERNIKYQYLIMASLILVACYRNSVSRVSTIQLISCNTDFESYFISVTNFRFVCSLPI